MLRLSASKTWLLRLRFWFVAPGSTEEMAAMFSHHGGNTHDAHHQEDGEENNRDNKYRHTAPLGAFSFADEPASVMTITGACEPRSRWRQNISGDREGPRWDTANAGAVD